LLRKKGGDNEVLSPDRVEKLAKHFCGRASREMGVPNLLFTIRCTKDCGFELTRSRRCRSYSQMMTTEMYQNQVEKVRILC
jgi:hypothetical protein